MKKVLSSLLSALLLMSVFTGCGSSGQSSGTAGASEGNKSSAVSGSTSQTAANGEKIKITVTRWGEIEKNDAEKMIVDKFNQENKEIEIVYDVVPGDGYGDRLTTSFSSGEGYDIFASGEGDFYKWVDTSLAAPMDDLMAADGEWTKDFNESILEMGKIQGKQYYIVRDYNPICLWYNKDVFDKNKVAYPTNDWTWDDLEAAAKQLTVKAADGSFESFGFNAQSWEYASLSYLLSNGIDIMNEDGTEVEGFLNSPELATAITKYIGYSEGDNRISPSQADFDAFGDASAMLINGNLAMTLNGGWAKTSMEESNVNYGTAVVPGTHQSYLCASAYAISTRCKNPEAAWEVIKALTGAECTELRAQYAAALPTIDSQLEVQKGTLGEKNMGLVDQLEYAVQPAGVRSALGNPTVTAFKEAYERILYKDGETQTILDEAVTAAKEGSVG